MYIKKVVDCPTSLPEWRFNPLHRRTVLRGQTLPHLPFDIQPLILFSHRCYDSEGKFQIFRFKLNAMTLILRVANHK